MNYLTLWLRHRLMYYEGLFNASNTSIIIILSLYFNCQFYWFIVSRVILVFKKTTPENYSRSGLNDTFLGLVEEVRTALMSQERVSAYSRIIINHLIFHNTLTFLVLYTLFLRSLHFDIYKKWTWTILLLKDSKCLFQKSFSTLLSSYKICDFPWKSHS